MIIVRDGTYILCKCRFKLSHLLGRRTGNTFGRICTIGRKAKTLLVRLCLTDMII